MERPSHLTTTPRVLDLPVALPNAGFLSVCRTQGHGAWAHHLSPPFLSFFCCPLTGLLTSLWAFAHMVSALLEHPSCPPPPTRPIPLARLPTLEWGKPASAPTTAAPAPVSCDSHYHCLPWAPGIQCAHHSLLPSVNLVLLLVHKIQHFKSN